MFELLLYNYTQETQIFTNQDIHILSTITNMEAHTPQTLFYSKQHITYLFGFENSKDLYSIGKYLKEHLKMAGGYWSIAALAALRQQLPLQTREKLVSWIKNSQNPDGGFGGNTNHDSHITSTLYAILLLAIFQSPLNEDQSQKVVSYVQSLFQKDGSFYGDIWGEVDTRFSYCGLSCLAFLNRLDAVDVKLAADYVLSCLNFDGSFGSIPGAESHAAYVFCCVGALKIAKHLKAFDHDQLARWLCERQTSKGGFNGRPEKLPDVCYSWWIFSTLCMIKKRDWIDEKALERFVLACQDEEGGIADRPGNEVDVFHTFFGLAALSLLDGPKYALQQIDPTFAIPKAIVAKIPHLASYLQ